MRSCPDVVFNERGTVGCLAGIPSPAAKGVRGEREAFPDGARLSVAPAELSDFQLPPA